ncbi:hypothetical protein GCM10009696_12200 [Kocuria himachalensis]
MTALAPRPPVAAVITDGPEAVTAARCAARIAADQGRPLLLLVPMLRSAFTADAVIAARVHREAMLEAEAVAARTRPILAAAGLTAECRWCGTGAVPPDAPVRGGPSPWPTRPAGSERR